LVEQNQSLINLNNYKIKKKIYECSRFTCYSALNIIEHTLCFIYTSNIKNPKNKKGSLFFEEMELIKNNSHKNILKILDYGINNDYNYVITEWYDGISFDKYLEDKKKFNFNISIIFVNMIVNAVDKLYSNGIIYRNIYPSFFLINHSFKEKTIKLIFLSNYFFPYNINIEKDDDYHLLESYLPLESLINTGRSENINSSLYSIGLFFYHITTSYNPFYSNSSSDIIHKKIGHHNINIDTTQGLPQKYKDILSNILNDKKELRKYNISSLKTGDNFDCKYLSIPYFQNKKTKNEFEKIVNNRLLRGESLVIEIASSDKLEKYLFFRDLVFSKTSIDVSYLKLKFSSKFNYIMLFKEILNHWYNNVYLNLNDFRKISVQSILKDSLSINRDIYILMDENFSCFFSNNNETSENRYFELERISIAMVEFLKVISKIDNGIIISIEGFSNIKDSKILRFIDVYKNLKGYPIIFIVSEVLEIHSRVDIYTLKFLRNSANVGNGAETSVNSVKKMGFDNLLDRNNAIFNISNGWKNNLDDVMDILILVSICSNGIDKEIISSIFGKSIAKINFLLQNGYVEEVNYTNKIIILFDDIRNKILSEVSSEKIRILYYRIIEYFFNIKVKYLTYDEKLLLFDALIAVDDERFIDLGIDIGHYELKKFNLFIAEYIFNMMVEKNNLKDPNSVIDYAKVKYYLGQYNEEIDYLLDLLKNKKMENNQIILEILSETYRKVGNYKEAIRVNNSRLILYGEHIYHTKFMNIISIAKGIFNHIGFLLFPQINGLSKKKDKHKEILKIYEHLNWIYRLSDNTKLLRNTLRMLNISEHFFYKEKEHTTAYGEVSILLASIGFRKLAKIYNSRAFLMYENTKKTEVLGLLHFSKGFIELWNGSYNESKIAFEISINSFTKLCDFWNLSMAYNGLGLVYYYKSDYNAISFFKKNLEISIKLNNSVGKSIALQTLADCFIEQGEFYRAKDYLNQSLKIAESQNDKYMLMISYLSMVQLLIEEEKYEKAVVYLEQAENLISNNMFLPEYAHKVYQLRVVIALNKIEDDIKKTGVKELFYDIDSLIKIMMKKTKHIPNLVNYSYYLKAKYCILIGESNKANNYFYKSINGFYSLGRKFQLAKVLYEYSKFLNLESETEKSLKVLNESFEIFNKIGAKKYIDRIKYDNKMNKKTFDKSYSDIISNKHWFSSTENIIKEILRMKKSADLYKYLLSSLKVRYNIYSGDVYEYQSDYKKLKQVKSLKNDLFDRSVPFAELKESYENNIVISGKMEGRKIGIFDVAYYIMPIQSDYQKFGVVYFDYPLGSKIKDEDIFEAKIFCEYTSISLEKIILNDLKDNKIKKLETKNVEAEKHMRILKKFVSTKILDDVYIYEKEPELGGMESEKTILLSDIRNFTEISTQLNSTDTIGILNSYFRTVETPIEENNGTIDKFMGDGMLAIFDTPNDAVNAAIGMMEKLRKYNNSRKKYNYSSTFNIGDLNIGIGISSGKVIVGNMGNKIKMDDTVIGSAVNLAQRMESLNKIYGTNIIVDNSVYNNLIDRDHYSIRSLDRVIVKGVSKSKKIYEIFDCDEYKIKKIKDKYIISLNLGFEMLNDIKYNSISIDKEKIIEILKPINDFQNEVLEHVESFYDKSVENIKDGLMNFLEKQD